jgi:single stranded DNA-binding protein
MEGIAHCEFCNKEHPFYIADILIGGNRMADFNKVILVGRLTRDPELRYTPKGTPVCDMSIAVNKEYTKDDGKEEKETCFIDVTQWGKAGEACAEWLQKGSTVLIARARPVGRQSRQKATTTTRERTGYAVSVKDQRQQKFFKKYIDGEQKKRYN